MSFPIDALEHSDETQSLRAGADLPTQSRAMFVSWMDHARARELADALGAELYVPGRQLSLTYWPMRYAVQGALTFFVILRRRPARILFTNPPFVAGLPYLLPRVSRRNSVVRRTFRSVQRSALDEICQSESLRSEAMRGHGARERSVGPRSGARADLRTLIVASPPLKRRERVLRHGRLSSRRSDGRGTSLFASYWLPQRACLTSRSFLRDMPLRKFGAAHPRTAPFQAGCRGRNIVPCSPEPQQ